VELPEHEELNCNCDGLEKLIRTENERKIFKETQQTWEEFSERNKNEFN
jgi:hypothetical protein